MKQKIIVTVLLFLYTTLSAEPLIYIPISVGDLIDKITILQVKLERIIDPLKRENVAYELHMLTTILEQKVPLSAHLQELSTALKVVNSTLWDIENAIRAKEAKKEFDKEFIKLARSVYINNNRRHTLKREINLATGSRIIEEKQYS